MTEAIGEFTAWRADLGLTLELPERIGFREEEAARAAIAAALGSTEFCAGLQKLVRRAVGRSDVKFEWRAPWLELTPATLERMELDRLAERVEIVPHRKELCDRVTYVEGMGRLVIYRKGEHHVFMGVSAAKFAIIHELLYIEAGHFADLMWLAGISEERMFDPINHRETQEILTAGNAESAEWE
jgi:hypothetical protein